MSGYQKYTCPKGCEELFEAIQCRLEEEYGLECDQINTCRGNVAFIFPEGEEDIVHVDIPRKIIMCDRLSLIRGWEYDDLVHTMDFRLKSNHAFSSTSIAGKDAVERHDNCVKFWKSHSEFSDAMKGWK